MSVRRRVPLEKYLPPPVQLSLTGMTHIPVSEICAGGRRYSSKSNWADYWLEGITREVTAESVADTNTHTHTVVFISKQWIQIVNQKLQTSDREKALGIGRDAIEGWRDMDGWVISCLLLPLCRDHLTHRSWLRTSPVLVCSGELILFRLLFWAFNTQGRSILSFMKHYMAKNICTVTVLYKTIIAQNVNCKYTSCGKI